MHHHQRHGSEQDLVEDQGVNAGPPIDEDADMPQDGGTPGRAVAPGPLDLLDQEPDRRVGLPEQLTGYPGQQRSIDTS
jgi:hypothetical protein